MKGSKPTYKTPRDLPLYTAVYRLLEQVDEMMNTFKRDRKHTLGQNIYNTTLDLFECIRVANDFPKERERALLELLGKYDRIATMIKFANEHYYIKMNNYLALSKPMASIERQANGWLRDTREKSESVTE